MIATEIKATSDRSGSLAWPRCWNCQKQLARSFDGGWDMDCPRCHARCTDRLYAAMQALRCPTCGASPIQLFGALVRLRCDVCDRLFSGSFRQTVLTLVRPFAPPSGPGTRLAGTLLGELRGS